MTTPPSPSNDNDPRQSAWSPPVPRMKVTDVPEVVVAAVPRRRRLPTVAHRRTADAAKA